MGYVGNLKLALNLLLHEPAKLLEERPHWPSTAPDLSATGDRVASTSPRRHCSSPNL